MSVDTTLKSIRYPNPEILHFEVKKMHSSPLRKRIHPLKDGPHLFTGGGGDADFFFTQNAKSRDRSVVAGSNLFWHTLWTLPALFGARTPPKSMCNQRHTPSKISTKKMQILGLTRPICACCPQIMWGGPAPSKCVQKGLEPRSHVLTPS